MGVFHPHAELHHIKKENIGLIEVMGLAVLPSRLKRELAELETAVLNGTHLANELKKHETWLNELKQKYNFTPENIEKIFRDEVGKVFAQVLEHAGVFKRTNDGKQAFLRFAEFVNRSE